MSDLHVELQGVSKSFGAIGALRDISLRFPRGQVHALVGENGAGKSTLGRLIAGVHAPDSGTMRVDGRQVRYASPRAALADGVTIIAQELMLVPQRTVLDNVFLGSASFRFGVVRNRRLRQRYQELSALAGFDIDPDAVVGTLRLADQQKVEILRALARDARLVVMDEPTAALSAREVERLLDVIRRLRDAGTTVIFVTHFLDQVLAVSDTVTVLRDGAVVDVAAAADETAESLVTKMLGRPMETIFPPRTPAPQGARAVLSVRGLTRRGAFSDVSLDVHAGEIVGLAGLVGAGRTEVVRAIFGADRIDGGEIWVDGERRRIRTPRAAIRAGLALVPESRKDEGLLMGASIQSNIALPHLPAISHSGWLSAAGERAAVGEIARQVGVRGATLDKPVSALSGGNQQKVMFAKWLLRQPKVLVIDEPTRGVDVGARQTIYELIGSLAAEGMGVLVVSSDAEEVLGISHRVLVMRQGRVVDEFEGNKVEEERLLKAAFGAEETVA